MTKRPGRRQRRLSARTRITAVVTVVFAVAVVAASVAFAALMRSRLIGNADQANVVRANDIAGLLDRESVADHPSGVHIPEARDNTDLAQVIGADGSVIAATQNLAGGHPLPHGTSGSMTVDGLHVGKRVGTYRLTTLVSNDPNGVARTVVVGTSLDPINRTVDDIIVALIVAAPLLTALVAALTWLAVGRSLRPVEAIRAEFSHITATNLHRRVPHPATNDEIGALADTLNGTLELLEAEMARQHEFTADAAHELRSPIAALAAQLELARSSAAGTTDEPVWSSLLHQARRLELLTDDLLVLAGQNGTHRSPRRLVDLDDVVVEEVQRARLTSQVPIDITAVSGAQVRGEPLDLTRVVRNLLDNAVRHAESRVTLTLSEHDDTATLVIDDDGCGIPASERDHVFERFTRLDEARDRRTGGTGLGLAIARAIAAAHDATITVRDSPSGGARLVVELPTASADEPRPTVPPSLTAPDVPAQDRVAVTG